MKLFGKKKKPVETTQTPNWPPPSPKKIDKLSQTQNLDPEALALRVASISEALSQPLTEKEQKTVEQAIEEPQPTEEEAERLQDRSLYNALLSGLYDAVLIIDEKGTVIGHNQRCEKFFGYNESEMWGIECSKLIANVNDRVLAKIRSHAESGRFTVVNTTCKRKDATTFPAEIAISLIDLLHKGDLIFSIRNHERRDKVKHRQETQRDALMHTGAGIAMCSSEGVIEYANPAFVKLLLLEEEKDVMHHLIGDFCHSIDAANALIKTPTEERAWFGTLDIITSKETVRQCLATATLAAKKSKSGQERRLVISLMPIPKAAK